MNKQITIGIKKPGKAWHFREAEDELSTYQQIVGGSIQLGYSTPGGILIFCNEEGKLQGLAPNLSLPYDTIVGTVFAVRSDEEGEFCSLTGEDIITLSASSIQTI